jgi:hypothetical protein
MVAMSSRQISRRRNRTGQIQVTAKNRLRIPIIVFRQYAVIRSFLAIRYAPVGHISCLAEYSGPDILPSVQVTTSER